MRIVYMGTPDFAVPCLEAIVQAGHQVVGVITQPDKPRGRGKQVQPTPVKAAAQRMNLPLWQPPSIKTEDFLQKMQELAPQCIVVVAYGKILPPSLLRLPPLGCINVHASLLPRYRGAAPIHWSVINGEVETGVTTMFMDEGMDTGDMILKRRIAIGPEETVGLIHDQLAQTGAALLVETLEQLERNQAPRVSQDPALATYAPMLHKEHEFIHWNRTALEVHNHVRGMNPWPGAYTTWEGRVLKIWRTVVAEAAGKKESPGTVLASGPEGIPVQTGDGVVLIKELQLQGSKKMEAKAFLRGKPILPGTVFGS
ncbi:methionyl-tRNA formyltransferase [Desulforamulus ruminis]|uniref:methionyl-tRNA formyltransferase n=1 Tax=Desulforamulus ruminis TaxID=1564 RepID=UPI002FDB1000